MPADDEPELDPELIAELEGAFDPVRNDYSADRGAELRKRMTEQAAEEDRLIAAALERLPQQRAAAQALFDELDSWEVADSFLVIRAVGEGINGIWAARDALQTQLHDPSAHLSEEARRTAEDRERDLRNDREPPRSLASEHEQVEQTARRAREAIDWLDRFEALDDAQ